MTGDDRGPGRPGAAAFDFDGTLVRGDSLGAYLARLCGSSNFARTLARSAPAMLAAYRVSGRDGAKAALLARSVAGIPLEVAKSHGETHGLALASRVRPAMAARLEWHRSRSHRLVLVSASLELYLEPFGRKIGFDEVIATRLEVREDGCLSGRLLGPNVRGEEKAVRLRSFLGEAPVELWAYGDSEGDRHMLAMADHPLLVNRSANRAAP